MKNNFIKLAALFLGALVFQGCTIMTHDFSPGDYPIEDGRIQQLTAAAPVTLINGQNSAEIFAVPVITGHKARVNYQEYTDVVLRQIDRELRKQNIALAEGGKSITVAVEDLQYQSTKLNWGMRHTIRFKLATGDGFEETLEVANERGIGPFQEGIQAALAHVVMATLNHPHVKSYLQAP